LLLYSEMRQFAPPFRENKETTMLARLIRDDQGQDLIEYALLGSFVAIAALAGATLLGTNINAWYGKVATWVSNSAAKVP
jgi:pilus assembly protein Flp/PilA